MPLYEVALIKRPTKKEAEDGAEETLVMPPTPVLSRDDQSAAIQAVMLKKDDIDPADMQRVQVLVRPFA